MPKHTDRDKHARRLVSLILTAQANRYMPDVGTLAEEHGVSTRTIRRDLAAIEEQMPVRWRIGAGAMSDTQRAGRDHAGRFCRKCDEEIQAEDVIAVDVDADSDGEGGWHDLTTVAHVSCPEAES